MVSSALGFHGIKNNKIASKKVTTLIETIIIEPAHDKHYNKTCATSEDSDQPAHLRRLIRVFADRMYLLQSPGYPKRDE